MNNVLKLNNGYLVRKEFMEELSKPGAETALQKSALAIQRLSERMDGRYVYVQTPYKVRAHDPLLPVGVAETTNETLDRFLAGLSGNGVDVMDLREIMARDGIQPADAFYRTDHHWLPETGFYAFRKIADHIFANLYKYGTGGGTIACRRWISPITTSKITQRGTWVRKESAWGGDTTASLSMIST
jgi:hypothetical protein